MTLVRVYCGLASTDAAQAQSDQEVWLTVAVVDDAGRLLDVCEISDDVGGYAELSALLAQRAGGSSAVAVATDNDDHTVIQLLTAAGRHLAYTDEDSSEDYAERFADEPPAEEAQATSVQRRAIGLARALQAGVLSAVPQSPPRDMIALKPLLSAHAAVVAGRQSSAATLREVLRELYPAALRAYPDPAEPIPLAILDCLPEPGLLGNGQATRNRDAQVVADLTAAGLSDSATLTESISALRLAIVETPRRTGVTRALTAAVSETIRQSVASVQASDKAASALVDVLGSRMSGRQPAARSGAPSGLGTLGSPSRSGLSKRTVAESADDSRRGRVISAPPASHVSGPPMSAHVSAPPASHVSGPPMSAHVSAPPASHVSGPPMSAHVSGPPAGSERRARSTMAAQFPRRGEYAPSASAGPLSGTEEPAFGSGLVSETPPAQPLPPRYDQQAQYEAAFNPPDQSYSAQYDSFMAGHEQLAPTPTSPASSVMDSGLSSGMAPYEQDYSYSRRREPVSPPGTAEGAIGEPSHEQRRVVPPWQSEDLPAEPPALRLVEPAVSAPPVSRSSYPSISDPSISDSLPDLRSEPPALRLVDSGHQARIEPPVASGDGDGDGDLLIFAAAKSAWFTDQPDESDDLAWSTNAVDAGWEAAEHATRPVVGSDTRSGLPRRVPQQNLVPGSIVATQERPLRIVRDAASIAANTTGYFQGWRRGQEAGGGYGGFSVGGRPGRESAGGWNFTRDPGPEDAPREYEYRSAQR